MTDKSKDFGKLIGDNNCNLNAFDLGDEEIQAVSEVIRSKRLASSYGTKTKEFENAFGEYIGAKYVTATTAETTALTLSLSALGIGPGDEVIVPACSSLATPNSVVYQNAVPIFADIDERTLNMDVDDLKIKITDRTKAIIVVHMYGCPGEIFDVVEIAKEKGIPVIEDCALAMGAEYNNKKLGSIGDIGCFSCGTGKQLNLGQYGLAVTNNKDIGEAIAKRNHHYGIRRPGRTIGESDILGYNFKPTEIQSAMGLVQLKKLDRLNQKRIENAAYLTQLLQEIECVETPYAPPEGKHVYNQYIIKVKEEIIGMSRGSFREALMERGIYSDPVFDTPMHLEKSYMNKVGFGKRCPFECPHYKNKVEYKEGLCPTSEKVLKQVLGLSVHSGLKKEDMDKIAEAIKGVAK
jgi:perosamine synthetase